MVARFFEESENVRTRTRQWRSWISVIFRVRSAKAVKITDAYLLKRLGLLCGFVGIALLVRTLVAPPVVIVGRTADNLKAFLCKTDWWDHTFTSSCSCSHQLIQIYCTSYFSVTHN
uniref:(northern house mosquito) hypothetical protein n=1 Tax=Culex pipiens TaxID=7175 RepID=A0A8D8G5J7_CULPI